MAAASDNPVYNAALAYQTTAALVAAVKLDIFTLIGRGALSAEMLAARTAASVRGLRILCDYLVVIGLLAKDGSTYSLTPAAQRYLDGCSPASVASSVDFFAAPEFLSLVLDDPAAYVRNGGAMSVGSLSPDHAVWIRFAHAVTPFAAPPAKRVAAYVSALPEQPRRVLDIAAGHGLYGIEIARACPDASVTAVDWEKVLPVALSNAAHAGVANRYQTVPGSAFDVEWGTGFDLILLPNFLHHFGHADCVALLSKARRSLSQTGRVLVIEFVPNEDRVSPPLQAMFAFWMLATTPAGDAHTLGDIETMAASAGLSRIAARPLLPTPQTLVVLER